MILPLAIGFDYLAERAHCNFPARCDVERFQHAFRHQTGPIFCTLAVVDDADKAETNRVRRKARRLGMRLEKSPRRDPAAADFATFALYAADGTPVLSDPERFGFGYSLGRVEGYLDGDVLVVCQDSVGEPRDDVALLRPLHIETRGRITAQVWQLTTPDGDSFELPQWSDVKAVELDARAILHRLRVTAALNAHLHDAGDGVSSRD